MKIAILGAGAFGTALGGILASNGYDIDYYDSRLEREKLSDTLSGTMAVVLCVPSKVAPYLIPYIPREKPLIVATKGILSDAPFKEFKDFMVISGPGFAKDIKAKKHTLLTVTDGRLKDLFRAEYMEFDETKDRRGVLMCGGLKNVYAIRAGVLKLERGTSTRSNFLAKVRAEMRMLLAANGADPKTVDLACGHGDLDLTCAMPSRNYEFGFKLADNPDYMPEKTVEGLSALRRIRRGEIEVPTGTKILHEILDSINEKEKLGD